MLSGSIGGTVAAMETPRQRVHAALCRKPADRLPVFMWFHPDTARKLAELLEVPAEQVGEAMGNDVLQTWVNKNFAMEGIVHQRDGEGHRDFWGIRWEKLGAFNQPAEFPLAEVEAAYEEDAEISQVRRRKKRSEKKKRLGA